MSFRDGTKGCCWTVGTRVCTSTGLFDASLDACREAGSDTLCSVAELLREWEMVAAELNLIGCGAELFSLVGMHFGGFTFDSVWGAWNAGFPLQRRTIFGLH